MDQKDFYGISSRKMLRRNSLPSVNPNDPSIYESKMSRSAFIGQPTEELSGGHQPTVSTSITSMRAARTHQHRLNAAQEQRTYQDSCQRLLSYIGSVTKMCEDLRETNKTRFPIRYPSMRHFSTGTQWTSPSTSASQSVSGSMATSSAPRQLQDLSVLNLDIKMGHTAAGLDHLEKQSIANLLDDKLLQATRHLEKLHARVGDKSSKVLVTGDLNAGKSTFVNALMKRELLPVDQQPCTGVFCEVLDDTLNDGVEQVHAIPVVELYDRLNPKTYRVIEMRHLYKAVTEQAEYKMLKIYARDARSAQESLLHNGVVDIALIDSPGLNTDSIKTTAIFARQEEIDVVVFVVSAENHFTLSGKEFLWNAANEKTHIFIVVNRFDSIRDKDRCRRLVLEQIRQLSPSTYADADDLVHFVSAGSVDLQPGSRKLDAPEFARLEERLRWFVLVNRTKSKLSPAKNYMIKLLKDIETLSDTNHTLSLQDHQAATHELEHDLAAYQEMFRVRDRVLKQIEKMSEATISAIQRHTVDHLHRAVDSIHDTVRAMEYPGILLIWQYAQDMADSMSEHLLKQVRQMEASARQQASTTLDKVHELGEESTGAFERTANVQKIGSRHADRRVVIPVEVADFFDLVIDDRLSSCALSLGAALALGSRMMGFRDAMSNLWNVSHMLGTHNIRRMAVPVLGLTTAGAVFYVVSDMRHAVERNLVRKFKTAARDSGYAEAQGRRLARDTRRVLCVETWEVQNRLEKQIQDKEQHRAELQSTAHLSEESMSYFSQVLERSRLLLDKISTVYTDGPIRQVIY